MKYLVVSDSHGMSYELEDLLVEYKEFDGFFHCGDSELEAVELSNWDACVGNTDYNHLPDFVVARVGSKQALITHSHLLSRYGMFNVPHSLAVLAKENNCEFVFYGHTHRFDDQMVDGVRIMNPGSLFRSRDDGSHSYAIFEIDENGEASFTRKTL